MNKYESVVIINPNVDEEGIKGLVKKGEYPTNLWANFKARD